MSEAPVHIDVLVLDLRRYELRRGHNLLKLEKIPMELLILLVERRDQLVGREEIIARLWGRDVFLDTEQGINTAIRKIRLTLRDDPDQPFFLQTVVGKGYRFVGPINVVDAAPAVKQPSAPVSVIEEETRRSWPKNTPQRVVKASVAALILLGALAVGIKFFDWGRSSLPPVEIVPLVSFEGEASHPAFSPDGNQIAFAMHGRRNPGIYILPVSGGKPLEFASGSDVGYPKWSPDGQQIAFLRESKDALAIYAVPIFGGIERRLYSGPATQFSPTFDWSPDGTSLAISQSDPDKVHARIALISLDTTSGRELTTPSEQEIDISPSFSPDGSRVAFVRSNVGGMVSEVYVVPVGGGEVKRLTYDRRDIWGNLAWTPDGREIVFSSTRGGAPGLWRIPASGGTPKAVLGGSVNAYNPVISRKGKLLAYQQTLLQNDIWRLALANDKLGQGAPIPTVVSKGLNARPRFSPDGKKIAFESTRSGYSEIWICGSDGSNCASLTSLHGVAGAAQWSPDGRSIAFEFHPKEFTEIFIAEVGGGQPRMVATFPGTDNGGPNWSRDGEWIYFYSNREGRRFQLWKVHPGGGSPIQVTKNGGIFGIESPDGKYLYFAKFQEPGIWRIPLNGGEETRILDAPEFWFNWSLADNGIYFLDGRSIQLFDFASRQKRSILELDRDLFGGLAISPDQSSLLFAPEKLSEANIILVKNFQ